MRIKNIIGGALVAAAMFAAAPASAAVYDFTFLGANYSATGTFTTGAADSAHDGAFKITSLSGTLTSANSALKQGSFSLAGGNAPDVTTADWLVSPDGAFDYSNLYVPGAATFAGGGFYATGTGVNGAFAFNLYNAVNGNYAACGAHDCASVTPDQGLYNPGDKGIVSITSAVPEPATWAMFLMGFGSIGFMLRGARRKPAKAFVRA